MPTLQTLDLLACALVGSVLVFIARRIRARKTSFPPGPPGSFVIGNALDFDPLCAWATFTEWKKTYGDLIGLNVLGTKILVLNSQKRISDLLEKRGNVYSDRPVFVAVGELMGLDQSMALKAYGAEWRACRKLEHMALSSGAVKQYEPMQERFAAMLARDIMDDPTNFYDLVRLCAARVVLSITYGLSARVVDTEYIDHAEETMKIISQSTVPGAFLCDFISILKYLPKWFPFQKKALHGKRMIEMLVTMPYERVKHEIAQGLAGPSLTRELLTGMSKEELTPHMESRIKWTTGSMYGAGSESTFGTTLVFIIAMALHPSIQGRAQAELDAVVGPNRLPLLSDRSSLPYVEALIKEVMRWHPMLPLSIARRTAQDDIYEGYMIPKGTVVIPNVWQMAYEANEKYPPHEFIPERFLDELCPTTDPSTWAFGFGRRICPGKLLAEANIFILITTLLATFRIEPPAEGELVPEFEAQLVNMPKRFKCKFMLRSERVAKLVNETATSSM